MEGKTIQLKFPIKVTATNGKESTLTEVTLRKPKGRDLKGIPGSAFNDNPILVGIALHCGLEFDVAEELDFEDIKTIVENMSSLEPGSQGTGEKSSGGSPESTTSPQTPSGT